MPKNSNDRGRTAANAVKRGAEAGANGIHQVTDFVTRNDNRVTDGGQILTQVVESRWGKAVEELARSVLLQRLIQPGIFQQLNLTTEHERLIWSLLTVTPPADCEQNIAFDRRTTGRLQ